MTVTMGIVSATRKSELGVLRESAYENFIQTDASINFVEILAVPCLMPKVGQ